MHHNKSIRRNILIIILMAQAIICNAQNFDYGRAHIRILNTELSFEDFNNVRAGAEIFSPRADFFAGAKYSRSLFENTMTSSTDAIQDANFRKPFQEFNGYVGTCLFKRYKDDVRILRVFNYYKLFRLKEKRYYSFKILDGTRCIMYGTHIGYQTAYIPKFRGYTESLRITDENGVVFGNKFGAASVPFDMHSAATTRCWYVGVSRYAVSKPNEDSDGAGGGSYHQMTLDYLRLTDVRYVDFYSTGGMLYKVDPTSYRGKDAHGARFTYTNQGTSLLSIKQVFSLGFVKMPNYGMTNSALRLNTHFSYSMGIAITPLLNTISFGKWY
jgi:hypothetical protein